MYARVSPRPNTARARRFGYERMAAPRPPRQVGRWRRLLRNLAIGGAVLGLLFLIFTSRALGATPPRPPRVVVVQPGQTVWSIAEAQFPNQDPRQSVYEIDQTNHLSGGLVYPGERLRLPAA
jgi:hypothetical protein